MPANKKIPDNFNHKTNPVVGIDLGTTFSCIAWWDGRGPMVYPGLDPVTGYSTIQSVVYMQENEEPVVGSVAHKNYRIDPKNGVEEIKREMGNPDFSKVLRGKTYSPIDISSIILHHIKKEIYKKFPDGIFDFAGSVVTHPYYFKKNQVDDTKEAAHKADIYLVATVPEPVAASLAYAWDFFRDQLGEGQSEVIFIFDLGGGTFDTTVLEIEETKDKLYFRVLSTGGDSQLGGMDFNRTLEKYILEQEEIDLEKESAKNRARAYSILREQVENTKKDLAAVGNSVFVAPNILPGKDIVREISRQKFEDLLRGKYGGRDYVADIKSIIHSTRAKAKKEAKKVLFVGGSSKIPLMKRIIEEEIPDAKIYGFRNLDQVVAEGAAIYAAHLDHRIVNFDKEIVIETVYAHNLGVKAKGNRFSKIINSNAPIPAQGTKVYVIPEKDWDVIHFELFEGHGDVIDDNALKEGKIIKIGEKVVPIPKDKKGNVEVKLTFTVGMTEEINVNYQIFHRKKKIQEWEEDLKLAKTGG